MEAQSEGKTNTTVSVTIVRACAKCGDPRQIDKNCQSCGNPDPPEVHDLGIQAADYEDPIQMLKWQLFGKRQAEKRARQANKELTDGDGR